MPSCPLDARKERSVRSIASFLSLSLGALLVALAAGRNAATLRDAARPASTVARSRRPPFCTDGHIKSLSEHIGSDQEEFALRPWSAPADGDGGSVRFSGLDAGLVRTALGGRRIFFWGDSTTQYLSYWLHIVTRMHATGNSTLFDATKLSEANEIVLSEGGDCRLVKNATKGILRCKNDGVKNRGNMTSNFHDGTSIRFIPDRGGCEDIHVHKQMKLFQPDVVVANAGLWWLHFQGRGRDAGSVNGGTEWKGCVVEKWLGYEGWLRDMWSAAEAAGAKVLLFKTTNRICDEKYTREFKRASRLYTTKDNSTIRNCFRDIKALLRSNASKVVDDANIMDYCENGTFNNHGSAHLNRRLLQFVEANQRNAPLVLRVFNDNAIQSCDYTKASDGRHFHLLNLARIRLLGNSLWCIDHRQRP